jgi:hypothetical protein
MELGKTLIWNGSRWIVRGFDPASVTERTVALENPETGERVDAPFDEVSDE